MLAHGRDERVVGYEAVAGDEPGGPQHPQRIVGERDLRRQWRPEDPGGQVGHASVGIDQLRRLTGRARDAERHGVDREVAAGEVGLHLVGEGHVGLARVGRVGLGAVGGDLEHRAVLLQPDGAEAGSLVPDGVGPPGDERGGLLGPGVGGEVDVGREGPTEHRVAHDPAHQVEAVAGRVEALRQRAHLVEDRGAGAPGSPRKATRCPRPGGNRKSG